MPVAFQEDLIRVKKEVFAKFRRDRICDVQQQELELGRERVDLNIRR